jgi:hypothetical protein
LIQNKPWFSFGEFVCLFVSILFLSFFIWQTSHFDFLILNTKTKDWHQKFLQIVLRNLLNWCKCVGKNNLNNVLYPFFILTSFHYISLFVFVCDWFDLILISFLLNTKWHWIELKDHLKDLILFVYPSLKFTLLKHTHSEFWNNLWDVIRFNHFLSMKTSTIINDVNEYLMKHEHKILN